MGTLGAGISSILARKRDHLNQCLKSHNLIREHWGKKPEYKNGKQTQDTNGFNGGLNTRFQERDLEDRSE